MGALSAFLTGAGGTGLMNVAQAQERRAEAEAQREAREREMAEQRAQRQREQDAQTERWNADRQSREDMLADRLDAGALARAGTGSRRGAGGPVDPVAERNMAINRLAAEHGLSRPQAEALLQSYESGNNPYQRTGEGEPQQIDDGDRQRTVRSQQTTPDVEKFASMMASVAKHMSQAGAYLTDDPKKQALAEQMRVQTGMAERGTTDPAAARGALLLAGKGEFGETGTSHVTGAPTKGSVAESQILENRAQANNANASAAQHSAMVQKIKAQIGLEGDDLKGKSKERLATMLNSLNAYVKDLNLTPDDVAAVNKLRSDITRAMGNEVAARPGGTPATAAAASPAPAAKAAAEPKVEKRADGAYLPKTAAEYAALPVGSLYVKDGKTYRKK